MVAKNSQCAGKLFHRVAALLLIFLLGACAGANRSLKPEWSRGERFERVGHFALAGTARQVFPLLCPVEEYKWLPDWSCTMFYSDSGVAEKNAVFQTTEILDQKVTWTTITYEPDKFIEYLMVSGINVVRLSIALEETKEQTTLVTWRMLFTSNSALAKTVLPRAFSEENFQKMMADRQRQLNFYLKNGRLPEK